MKDSPDKLESLVRSLNLIPYLHHHPGATPMEIARDLGYTHDEVMIDLTRLTMSGVGSGPGELIDLVADWTGITVIDDQGLNKPLRLTPTEANALLLTLESLETMPGLVDQAAVSSAAEKLRKAVGGSVDDTQPEPGDTGAARVVSDAIAASRQIVLTYYSASSGATTTRRVTPVDIFHRNGATYLRAYEGGEEEPKSFRFDRIKSAQLADAPSAAPPAAARFDPADPFGFRGSQRARLRIRREATWLADYWDIELAPGTDSEPGDWVDAEMPFGSGEWLVKFCLSQADRVTLVDPPELAREVAARAKAALDALS